MENKPCSNNRHQWANVVGAYYRVCRRCHFRYDPISGHVEPPATHKDEGQMIIG